MGTLVLSSLNAVIKETSTVPWRLWRASPDPRLGSEIELSGRHAGGLRDLLGRGLALPSQGIAAEEPPPALLQIEPAGPCRNEDVLDAGMIDQPGPRLEAGMTTEIVGDDEDIPGRIVSFDVGE